MKSRLVSEKCIVFPPLAKREKPPADLRRGRELRCARLAAAGWVPVAPCTSPCARDPDECPGCVESKRPGAGSRCDLSVAWPGNSAVGKWKKNRLFSTVKLCEVIEVI